MSTPESGPDARTMRAVPAVERIAILTSGGDAPGMNAAIRAATLLARAQGCDVLGVAHGYQGLIEGDFVELGPREVAGMIREGGTMLGSVRCPEFLDRAMRDRARSQLRQRRIGGLIVIGGNGSLAGAEALSNPEEAGEEPTAVIGIPASIDNDIGLTSLAIGVDTAMNTIVEACDRIADTASAHDRVFIVEVMGRDCGYLAMTAAIASGADGVLYPESGRSEDQTVAALVRTIDRARSRAGRTRRVIVIKAEGIGISADRLKHRIDDEFATRAANLAPKVETRVTVLGHLVRGGRPSAFDRLLGSRFAHVAVRALLAGQTRKMTAWHFPGDPPPGLVERTSADPYCLLVDLAAVLKETRDIQTGASPIIRWRAHILDEIEDVLSL